MSLQVDGYALGTAIDRALDGSEQHAVWPLDLPGCIAQGDSFPEALMGLYAILPGYKAALALRGVTLPLPKPAPAVTVKWATFAAQPGAIPAADLWETPIPAFA